MRREPDQGIPRPSAVGGLQDQSSMAQIEPPTRFEKALAVVPRALSSHPHIIFLIVLGVYLVVLPLLGVNVSAKAELIGGNYTNVTSDLGACIAAGLTVHLARKSRKHSQDLAQLREHLNYHYDALHSMLQNHVDEGKGQ